MLQQVLGGALTGGAFALQLNPLMPELRSDALIWQQIRDRAIGLCWAFLVRPEAILPVAAVVVGIVKSAAWQRTRANESRARMKSIRRGPRSARSRSRTPRTGTAGHCYSGGRGVSQSPTRTLCDAIRARESRVSTASPRGTVTSTRRFIALRDSAEAKIGRCLKRTVALMKSGDRAAALAARAGWQRQRSWMTFARTRRPSGRRRTRFCSGTTPDMRQSSLRPQIGSFARITAVVGLLARLDCVRAQPAQHRRPPASRTAIDEQRQIPCA